MVGRVTINKQEDVLFNEPPPEVRCYDMHSTVQRRHFISPVTFCFSDFFRPLKTVALPLHTVEPKDIIKANKRRV
jgi:hypothetical protein